MSPDELRTLAARLQDEAADDDDPRGRRFGSALAVLFGIEAALAAANRPGWGAAADLENLRRAVREVAGATAGLHEGEQAVMTMRCVPVPFDGEPPKVEQHDRVEVRDSFGDWHEAIACSAPRYDFANAIGGRCYLTVQVINEEIRMAFGHPVNWPAEDVRLRQ